MDRKLSMQAFGVAVMLVFSQLVLAASVFDPLTTAIDFTTVIAALFVAAVAIVTLMVTFKGIKAIFRLLGWR